MFSAKIKQFLAERVSWNLRKPVRKDGQTGMRTF